MTMKIAVFTHNKLALAGATAREFHFGRVPGLKETGATAVVAQQFHPLDPMFFLHGMRNRAHLDLDALLGLVRDRHMFFLGGVGHALPEERHEDAAASKLPLSALKHFHNSETLFAFVYFKSLGHTFLLQRPPSLADKYIFRRSIAPDGMKVQKKSRKENNAEKLKANQE
jgi:hypothetical protein